MHCWLDKCGWHDKCALYLVFENSKKQSKTVKNSQQQSETVKNVFVNGQLDAAYLVT